MRLMPALAPFALLLALPFVRQDPPPGDGDDDEPSPGISSLFETERARIEEQIVGTWLLMEYQPAGGLFQPENIRGVAMFHDGYLSLNIAAQTFTPEFLGDGRQLYVQGGAHRYRISELVELQTAAIVAFQNLADDDEVVTEPPGLPREYSVDITEDGDEMTLRNREGAMLRWSRMEPTEFPVESLDALREERGR